MNQKFTGFLKTFLIWFALFYLIFWGLQMIMGDLEKKPEDNSNPVTLVPVDKSPVMGHLAKFALKNNTEKNIAIIGCDVGIPINFSRVINGQNIGLLPEEKCITSEIKTVMAGTSEDISFPEKNSQIFTEEGKYKLTLKIKSEDTEEIQTIESEPIVFSQPGMFRQLFRALVTKPLFNILVALMHYFPGHSLGWAIVLLTLLVRLALFLPNQKAMKSQRKLQKLQPKIEEIRKKHGKNQQAMAMKTMELYRTHKINPMSSCLPILIQMPFLIGIYFVVQGGLSEHLRFLLYSFNTNIDLKLVDPVFFGMNLEAPNIWVLPILVGLAQWAALKLAFIKSSTSSLPTVPQEGMAAQMQQMQKMMVWVFPIMIAVFTFTFPAGVGVYWLVSTLFGIGQQQLVNWQLDRNPEVTRRT
jgi:YidC/Oxa1 family membrane protein insertase